MRRYLLIALAAGLGLLAAGLLVSQWLLTPAILRVAVGTANSDEARLIGAIAQTLARDRESVRLKPVVTDGVRGNADAMTQGEVDLAIVRTDVSMPTNAQTVAILHRDAVVLITLERTGIARPSDLAGRRIGVVGKQRANVRLLEQILAHYDVTPGEVAAVPLGSPAEVEDAFRSGRIDAVLTIGPTTGGLATETVAAVSQAGGGLPVFIPIGEAEAMVERSPTLEATDLVRGAFGGNPPRPAEALKTLAVSHLLVAASSLDDSTVAELTRLIFAMRPALSNELPLANRIEEPDTSKGSPLPVHAGAAAYYDGEVLNLMERYGDWVYLVIMIGSIAGSTVAGLAGVHRSQTRSRTIALLNELLVIVHRARVAQTEPELGAVEADADRVLAEALAKASDNGVDHNVMMALFIGLDQARRAISERRQTLAEHPTEPAVVPRAAE